MLRARLPTTSPVSERVGAETWSGVSRRWRIAPMIPGDIPVPAQAVRVTWSDPDGGEDLTADLPVDAVTFRGVVPEGAEGLDPFIAASGLRLERRVEPAGDAAGADPDAPGQGMAPGDSVTVTLTATVEGVSPIFLPALAPWPRALLPKAYPLWPSLLKLASGADRSLAAHAMLQLPILHKADHPWHASLELVGQLLPARYIRVQHKLRVGNRGVIEVEGGFRRRDVLSHELAGA